jgi:hypothetical protein
MYVYIYNIHPILSTHNKLVASPSDFWRREEHLEEMTTILQEERALPSFRGF